ncbi:MAG: hypothetical protein HKN23_15475 [Verrucomicrobiales bacterium]|nr:hypothetical protein [Verrucomicrobiales bacterium]
MNHFSPGHQAPAESGQEPLFPGFPTLDIGALLRAVIGRIKLIAGVFGGFVALALVYVLVAPKWYESTAIVLVSPKKEKVLDINSVNQPDFESLDALKSLSKTITNGTSIVKVIDRLNLRNDPNFLKPVEGGYSDAEIIEIMWNRVSSELDRGTRLIGVTVKDKDPKRARDMALAFVEEFELTLVQQNIESAQRAKKMLETEAGNQLKRVEIAEDALQKFREENSHLRLDEEGNFAGTTLGDLDRLLSDAKNARLHAEAERTQLELINPEEDPERVFEIGHYVEQEHIAKLLLFRNQKRAEFAKVRRQFTPSHPTYKDFEDELAGIEEQVRLTAGKVADTIRKRVKTAEEHEKNLMASVQEQKTKMLELDGVLKQFRAKKRAVDAAYQTYHSLLERINETDVTEGVTERQITISDQPVVPDKPSSPKKKVTVILAGMLGGMMGLGLVLVLQLLDRSLKTRRQVESTLGLSVLAEIPQAFDENWELRESLFVSNSPASLVSEGFRALRTSLSALSPRSVMITSASPADGKSFCAANLALLQAQYGYRTLLVDADFRKPSLAKALLTPGMGDPGSASLSTQNICQKTPFPNLSLITCGQFIPNSGETMSGEHFAAMLWEAYRSFDCVIIDSSPAGVVSDALSYARYADAVMVVVRSGVTQTGDAQRVVQELRRMRAPLAGCILNGSTEQSAIKAQYYEDYRPAPAPPVAALPMNSDPAAEEANQPGPAPAAAL